MFLHPVSDYVLIRRDPPRLQTSAGFAIHVAAQHPAFEGTVLAIGPGRLQPTGARQPMQVQPGERVAFHSVSPNREVPYEGETLLLLRETYLLGVLEG